MRKVCSTHSWDSTITTSRMDTVHIYGIEAATTTWVNKDTNSQNIHASFIFCCIRGHSYIEDPS